MENDTNKRLLEVKSIGVIVEGKYKFTTQTSHINFSYAP